MLAARLTGFICIAAMGSVAVLACVSRTFQDGWFTCDTNAPVCPPDMSCGMDGRCYRTPPDASLDAGLGEASAQAERFCARAPHDICVDFDDGSYAPWFTDVAGDGRVVVDPGAFVSPPYSLLASLGPSGEPGAQISANLAAPAVHLVCQFQVRVEEYDHNAHGEVLLFQMGADGPDMADYKLIIMVNTDQASLGLWELGTRKDGSAVNDVPYGTAQLKLNAWQAVIVDAELSASSPAVSLTLDGALRGRFPITAFDGAFTHARVGALMSNVVSAPTRVRADDVACDRRAP